MNQASGAGPVGQTRNPVMVLLISFVCAFYGLFQLWTMMNELKAYLNKDEIQAWHILIPYYNLYLLWIKVPKWIGEAKQKAGSANPQPAGFILYFLIPYYAMADDLNQVWNPRGALPAGQPG